jgi:mannose-1-phosphate guanylyltransferase/mannose-6-phosphate isomerase
LDQGRFEEAVIKAQKLALKGELVTFGIQPDGPETGYGYMEYNGNQVERFIEKPSLELAQEYLQKGNFLWNSGMFCFSAGSILQEMELYCPLILNNVRCSIYLSNNIGHKNIELNYFAFSLVPKESIDYAVMEKSDRIVVVPCDIGWKDIGTWDSLSKLSPADADGNRIKGNAILHDVSNCYIENNGQLVGVVGVQNLAIISTKNGLLVTNKENSEAVRNIYSQLHDNTKDIQEFPWGKVQMIQKNQLTIISHVEINPGATAEIVKNFQYAANWIVTHGLAQFLINNLQTVLSVNESKYIPQGGVVSIANIGNEPLIIITVQLDDYLVKKDIVVPNRN